ncbi:MAG TPA: diaminopimelate decarboxylase, partial [Thermoanaerobaculia bacterium]
MINALTDDGISQVFRVALADDTIVETSDTALIFLDMTGLATRIKDLQKHFPSGTLHAVAIKANPLVKILSEILALGAGLEAASLPELCIAANAGADPPRIVFDSPAKTVHDLLRALTIGCHINADSIDELDRIARIKDGHNTSAAGSIGVRINPQVGAGTIAMTSVAAQYSKFGVNIGDQRADLIDRFLRYDWLTGVHVHTGSQGCSPELLLDGVGILLDFVHEADTAMRAAGLDRQVTVFDLGGGLPVSYHHDTKPYSMEEYATHLRERFPELFDGRLRLITEFGR